MARIILETPRLLLREMEPADMPSLASMLRDERVMYAYNGAFSEEETAAWMQRQLQRYNDYGFARLHFDRIYSIIRDTNIASQRVALRNGMKAVDTIVKHYRGVDMPHTVYCVERVTPDQTDRTI